MGSFLFMQRMAIYFSQSNMKQLTYTIFLLLLLGSCSYPCRKSDGFIINFINYTEQEVSSYNIKKYFKGTNFSKLVDSLVIDASVITYMQNNDTLQWTSSSSVANLISDFDYQILVPSTGSQYQITEIFEPQQEDRKSMNKVYCVNSIVSCKVNGVETKLSFDNLYLKK